MMNDGCTAGSTPHKLKIRNESSRSIVIKMPAPVAANRRYPSNPSCPTYLITDLHSAVKIVLHYILTHSIQCQTASQVMLAPSIHEDRNIKRSYILSHLTA